VGEVVGGVGGWGVGRIKIENRNENRK